jgi:prolyl-tRNA synthetase
MDFKIFSAARRAALSPVTRTSCRQCGVVRKPFSLRPKPICTRLSLASKSTAVENENTTTSKVAATKQQKKNQQEQGGRGGGSKHDEGVTPRSEDFGKWYLDVLKTAELADYGPVRGTMVIRPYGYAIWEQVQSWLDREFKRTGHQNCYFPQLIPYSFIEKESSHVEGFSPELALVTKGGGKELDEPLVMRPTSETMVNHMFSQWVKSYRDLPLLVNQWCNVTRWEMRTRPFVRTLEFLWQEGHTAHATAEEAEEETVRMVRMYEEFAYSMAAMPVVTGRKSRIESFAGADCTYTIEAMMGDKKALQAGTSHNLGQNFAKAFDIRYLDQDGELKHVYQTSWGVSTRMVGGVIMSHGDDKGLKLPPYLAPIQVVILPIGKKEKDLEAVNAVAQQVQQSLDSIGIRCKIDDSTGKTPGWKFNYWEMKGVPVRIEIGARDLETNSCVVARRDMPGKEGKTFGVSVEPESISSKVKETLQSVHEAMLAEATAFRDENIVDVKTYDELKAVVDEGKWARGYWAGSDDLENQIKEETGATLRCFPFEQPQDSASGECFMTQAEAQEVAIFAKSY